MQWAIAMGQSGVPDYLPIGDLGIFDPVQFEITDRKRTASRARTSSGSNRNSVGAASN